MPDVDAVVHDLNNELGIIISYAALAAMKLPEGTRLHEDIAEIQLAAERAADLTRALLG
ncbi:MAG: hypothetical protein JWM73_1874 [Solirubrobacterales bacterium]|nr:hypothetical protein [Solirubrobacterales bacterium]